MVKNIKLNTSFKDESNKELSSLDFLKTYDALFVFARLVGDNIRYRFLLT